MDRPISTFVHGILDYVTAPTLIMLPRMLKLGNMATNILSAAGLGVLGYSVMTRYELGVFKLLPMKTHLTMDIVSGAALTMAPFLFVKGGLDRMPAVRLTFLGFGLFEIAAGLMTKTQPSPTADESPITNVKNAVASGA